MGTAALCAELKGSMEAARWWPTELFAHLQGLQHTSVMSGQQLKSGRCWQAVADVPLPVESREALYKRMREQGFSIGLQHWMGSNLTPGPDQGLVWAFDLAGARSMYK